MYEKLKMSHQEIQDIKKQEELSKTDDLVERYKIILKYERMKRLYYV